MLPDPKPLIPGCLKDPHSLLQQRGPQEHAHHLPGMLSCHTQHGDNTRIQLGSCLPP